LSTSLDGLHYIELVRRASRVVRDGRLYDSFTHQAFWRTIHELRLEGIDIDQERTILEADAYIAARAIAIEPLIAAVLSQAGSIKHIPLPLTPEQNWSLRILNWVPFVCPSLSPLQQDSDFIVLDCPFIPLDTLDLTGSAASATCRFIPKGHFSSTLYDKAIAVLCEDRLAPLHSRDDEVRSSLCTLTAFRLLLADYATLSGNDYFKLVGVSAGFVTKPRIPLLLGRGDRVITFDVMNKEMAAQFLVVCKVNGWVDDSGRLDMGVLEPYLFTGPSQQKMRRKQQYLAAR